MPGSNKTDTRKEKLLEALKESMGIVSMACDRVGVHRSTYYDWYNSDEQFAAVADETAEYAHDFVESKLFENIEANDVASIIFYLKTKAKKRGYVEKQEFEHSVGTGTKRFILELEPDEELVNGVPKSRTIEQ
jgi:hypothetical protein